MKVSKNWLKEYLNLENISDEELYAKISAHVCEIEVYEKLTGKYINKDDVITYVQDRSGHDLRYSIDSTKLQTELGWKPEETFETGIKP